ncbi:MAG: ANTAR domain-containing protein [Planctomycetota bacterium]|jgi:ActR/RegA family two-component response regulator
MTRHPSVLISLPESRHRDRLERWVAGMGYLPSVTADSSETVAWVRERRFVASLLDSGLASRSGERVWRVVRPVLGRRLVLVAETPSRTLWFEALRSGVGAVLPLPARESMVRAALAAATGCGPWGDSRIPSEGLPR